MNYLLILAALLFLAFYARRVIIAHRYPHYTNVPFPQVNELCAIFFRNTLNGSYFVITLEQHEELAFQFFKYIEGTNVRFVVDFPVSPQTKPYYRDSLKRVQLMHLQASEHPLEPKDPRSEVEFVVNVDFGDDTNKLLQFIKLMFFEVYQAKEDHTFDVHFSRSLA